MNIARVGPRSNGVDCDSKDERTHLRSPQRSNFFPQKLGYTHTITDLPSTWK